MRRSCRQCSRPELRHGADQARCCCSRIADVFAFGVVMWEVATWLLPWGAANPWQLVGQVLHGGRLELPVREELPGPDTPAFTALDEYARIMERCWAQAPQDRPTFEDVVPQLRELLAQAPQAAGAVGDAL